MLAGVDALIAGGVLLLAYEIWKNTVHPAADNMAAVPWGWVLGGSVSWITLSWLAGSYDLDVADRLVSAAKRCLTVSTLVVGEGLAAYLLFLKTYPRPALAFAVPAVPALVFLWRAAYAAVLHRPASATRIVVLGDGEAHISLGLVVDKGRYFRIVGLVAPDKDGAKSLPEVVDRLQAHRIVVAPRLKWTDEMVASLTSVIERGVEVLDFNTAYEEVAGKVAVEYAGDQWLAALPTRVTTSAFEEAGMRALDAVGAAVGGAVSLIVFPLIAASILITSRGPILYRQTRLARGGKPFTIYKFRTMAVDAESSGAQWAGLSDPRVTAVGSFLRRTHLDELPQFWNVLRGDMSLVGPRPERPEFTDSLSREIPFYRLRLSVRPGLTGQKQIKVGYAATSDEHLEVLRHDLYYIKHRSIALNVAIIAQTVGTVIGRRGR